jgi:hypothetical protein
MKTYKAHIAETREADFTVKANSLESAKEKAEEMYQTEEIVLYAGDFSGYRITVDEDETQERV